MAKSRTLFDKIWDSHVVSVQDDGSSLLYIDKHIIHEVTTPQAFEGLKAAGRKVRQPEKTLAVIDHNIATTRGGVVEEDSLLQIETLRANVADFGVQLFEVDDPRNGIVHVIGPEQGFTQPGNTLVCGDSHTATHGAFGALAFGIGTSEVEHVLATQTLIQAPAKNMRVTVTGELPFGCSAKDIVLTIIGTVGIGGGTGHVIEFAGPAIKALSMEGRMTISNMAIEAGARAGLIAPDEKTFKYVKGRPFAPKGAAWEMALAYWKTLPSDEGAVYDKDVTIDISGMEPKVTWGTTPQDVVPITGIVPDPKDAANQGERESMERALKYMGLVPGTRMQDIEVDVVFIGSCTNGRIEDIRQVAKVAKGRKVADSVQAMIVPGSGLVKLQAEQEGLDKILLEAGFEWREPGCSMCLAMNVDKMQPGQRSASTSNRNFEGRQGRGSFTHLVSPAMAAAAAVTGHLADPREFLKD